MEVRGGAWLKGVNKVRLSLAATVTTAGMNADGVSMTKGVAGEDITNAFKKRLPLIDHDAIYRELAEMKRQMRWWNFAFDRDAIQAALASDRYEIFGLPATMPVKHESDLTRFHRIATTIVRRLFEGAYRKQESGRSRYALIDICESGIPEKYRKEFIHVEEA